MEGPSLKPITPREARNLYLDERSDAAYDTRQNITSGTESFVEWADDAGIDNMNNIGGRELRQFKTWYKKNGDVAPVSLNGVLAVIRRFLVFCVNIEAVYPSVPDRIPFPEVDDDDDVSEEKPSDELVEAVMDYLDTYEPASRRHVEYRLVKENTIRLGAVRSIDEKDVFVDDQYIRLRHRPEKEHHDERGTPLKNGTDSQRKLNISRKMAEVIQNYLDSPKRPDVTDKFGRKPLLTTNDGRPDVDTIRRDLYNLTRPCLYTDDCPHGRDIDDCKARLNRHASECPSSHSPHPLRRWSIEHQIDQGIPKEKLVDRADVSLKVLNEHYDRRSEERKRQDRLDYLEMIFDDFGDPDATIEQSELVNILADTEGMTEVEVLQRLKQKQSSNGGQPATDPQEEADNESGLSGDQMQIDHFTDGTPGIVHPLLAPAFGCLAVGRLMTRRLRHELTHLTSRPGISTQPSPRRAIRGTAAYLIFVGLIMIDLALLGVFAY